MAMNPVERKAFILEAMIDIGAAFIAHHDWRQNTQRARGSGAEDVFTNAAYEIAVALADKYDAENP